MRGRRRDIPLFWRVDWFSVQEHQKKLLAQEIEGYDEDKLLNTPVDDVCEYFAQKFDIDVPVLQEEGIVADQRETQIDVAGRIEYLTDGPGPHLVPGTTVEITIPFVGESEAFHIKPSAHDMNPPRGRVKDETIVFEVTGINMSPEEVRSQVDATIAKIKMYLVNLAQGAQTFRADLPRLARELVERRRETLLANRNLVASLGFKLKESTDSPQTYTAPEIRRKLSAAEPPSGKAPFQPEPSLSEQDYEHILEVLQNMTHVMERSPAAFAAIDEETLRTHFLMQLNGHYEGQATGETFNFEGKTDILIRSDGKNIFIGECKFWGGPKRLLETIDQLLGYSSWRDTKVALLIFNRNKDTTKVLRTIEDSVPSHRNYKRTVGQLSETSFRYVFSHRDDESRELVLTILVFDVPS